VQQRRQRNIYTAIAVIGAVAVVIAVIITVSLTGGGSTTTTTNGKIATGAFPLPANLIAQVESVPVDKLISAAEPQKWRTAGQLALEYGMPPQALPAKNPAYSVDGKPAIVYVGAEYCPYCAAERWALVMAMSKFGTFSDLRGTTSSATDNNPSTPTFSFYGSSYSSPYLSFESDEQETNTDQPLQSPTAAENALVTKYDTAPYIPSQDAGENPIPFIYLAGKYVLTGNQYDASPIAGDQWATAASYMTSGKNSTSKSLEASAGYLIGDLCAITHDQPAAVCSQVPSSLKGVTISSPVAQASSVPTTTAKTPATTAKAPSTTAKAKKASS
jgi:hypothetical protein